MKYLLDTCVISELVAKQPNPNVLTWIDSVDPDRVYLSVITIGEITKGIEKSPRGNNDISSPRAHQTIRKLIPRIVATMHGAAGSSDKSRS